MCYFFFFFCVSAESVLWHASLSPFYFNNHLAKEEIVGHGCFALIMMWRSVFSVSSSRCHWLVCGCHTHLLFYSYLVANPNRHLANGRSQMK